MEKVYGYRSFHEQKTRHSLEKMANVLQCFLGEYTDTALKIIVLYYGPLSPMANATGIKSTGAGGKTGSGAETGAGGKNIRAQPYEEIFIQVWGEEYADSSVNTLSGTIHRLQKKLSVEPDIPNYISNVHHIGYIRRNATSKLWVNDIREFANVGDEKQVEVVALKRDPVSGEVTHLEVSIKGAEEIPYTELRTGNTYTGKICSFSDTAYYVRVAGVPMDVRCPISSNNIMDTLDVGDFVKFVVRGVYDATPTGSIRKIIKKAVPTTW